MRRVVRAEARKIGGNRAAWLVGALAPLAVAAVAVAAGTDPTPGAVAASLALTVPIVLMPLAALAVTIVVALVAAGILHLTAPGGPARPVDLVETALRCGVLGGLTAVLGVVVGALTCHGATAVAVLLAWSAVLERLLAGLPEIGPVLAPFLPLANLRYFTTGDDGGVAFLWDQNAGAAYVLALCAVLAVAGVLATERVQP
jgi:ABC-2 type transport system permease protein